MKMKIIYNGIEYDKDLHLKHIENLGGVDAIKQKINESNLYGEQYYLLHALKILYMIEN